MTDTCPQHILNYLNECLGKSFVLLSTTPAKSAQQCVLILRLQFTDCIADRPEPWRSALVEGNQHLVVRIWKAASRWWNLNHVEESQQRTELMAIAQQEIWGYQEAFKVFSSINNSNIRIPRVLHFENNKIEDNNPWVIMEYVGPISTLFQSHTEHGDWDQGWEMKMIKIRMEYGFLEPHPRWGRVPVKDALEYAILILHSVIVPIHKYCWRSSDSAIAGSTKLVAYDYKSVLRLCKMKYQTVLANFSCPNDFSNLHLAIKKLQSIHDTLERRCIENNIPSRLSPVLVHMDLQPQNILFRKTKVDHQIHSVAVSVLDWEETAWADPRFELLLLCRKVCANREQANHIWDLYEKYMDNSIVIGDIQPWLELETVHSVTALLLQAVASGGRSPWEERKDLVDKLDREFQRFKHHDTSS